MSDETRVEDMSWPSAPAEPERAEQAYLTGMGAQVAELVVRRLLDAGLHHDDRPLLSPREAAERLGIGERTLTDLIAPGPGGEPPVIESLIVGRGGRKIEPREIDRYLEDCRRRAAGGRS
jgi:hypothetical protein